MAKKRCYEVRESEIHNRGVFATEDIAKDRPIIQYRGEKVDKKESDRRSVELIQKASQTGEAAVYMFTLNDEFDIDGNVGANPAKYINHSCNPNCDAYIIDDEVWIYSIKKIKKGAELCYNYGFDLDTWEDHECCCGAKNCVGFIVGREYWPKLNEAIKKRLKELQEKEAKRLKKEDKKAGKKDKDKEEKKGKKGKNKK